MYEIVKQYAGTILVGMSALLIILMLFKLWPSGNGSVMSAIGAQAKPHMENRVVDWENRVDKDALTSHANRNRPTVTTKRHAIEKISITMTDLLVIKDCDNRDWDSVNQKWINGPGEQPGTVDIISIKNSGGHEVRDEVFNGSVVWDKATQTFTFPEPDTFIVNIRITDYDNVQSDYQIPVAVDMQYP